MLQTSTRRTRPCGYAAALVARPGIVGGAELIRQQDEAFVLGTHSLGEADRIVTFFTGSHGKLRAVARGAARSRRRFGGLLEPLTRVRVSWVEREGRDLQRLEGLEPVRSFAAMQSEPVRQAACAVLAEIVASFAHEGQSDAEEFRLLAAVLDALEGGGKAAVLVRYFEYWTLKIHGLLPDVGECAACGKGLSGGGGRRVAPGQGVLCGDCPRLDGEPEGRLSVADLAFLDVARHSHPTRLPEETGSVGPGLELLLRGTLEAFVERRFRAYRHLKSAARFPAEGDAT